MLTQETLAAALPLAERCEDARIAVYPVQGSPLEAMVNATRSDEGLFTAANSDVNAFIGYVAAMANKVQPTYGVSHHNATLDTIAATAIAAVTKHLQVAKNVVRPVVNDLYTRVKASLSELEASSLLGMEVQVLREPAPLENAHLQNAVRKFEGLTIEDLPLTLRLPDQTPGQLQELVMTGSSQLDSAIVEWLSHDEGLLSYIWTHVFQNKPVDRPRNFLAIITDREYGVSNALAIYLFARKLTDSKPLEGTEMGLAAYRQQIVDMRNQAAAALTRALDKIERSLKNGILVRDVVDGVKTVVYEPLYRRFLEQGGSNEMLFANNLNGTSFMANIDELLQKKQGLAERWNMHVAMARTVETNKRFNKVKELIVLHFNAQLAEIAASEDGLDLNISAVHQLLDTIMADVRESDTKDLRNLCMKVVCRARFYRTDAERILSGIDQAMIDNPQLSVREAACISTLNYVADWMTSMFRVVSI